MSDLGADACQQQCSWCQSLGQSLLLLPRARLLHSGVQASVVTEPMFSFPTQQTLKMPLPPKMVVGFLKPNLCNRIDTEI